MIRKDKQETLGMKRKLLFVVLVSISLLMIFEACVRDEQIQDLGMGNYSIRLKWNKGYGGETVQQAEVGLMWGMSFLGAEWPITSYHKAVQWLPGSVIQLNLAHAGFSESALKAFEQVIKQLLASEEYKRNGAIDLGRFIMLTLNASNHYYKITSAAKTFNEYKAGYLYNELRGAIIESAISKGHRKLWLPAGTTTQTWSFVAEEGPGRIDSGTFEVKEFEVFDIMANGQLRFNMFDVKGNRLLVADKMYSDAGKPAKCLWCHEIYVSSAFDAKTSVPGYLHLDSFDVFVKAKQKQLDEYRKQLNSKLDYTKKQDHTQLELLYISFCEPSAERLALEWSLSVDEVKRRLSGYPTHNHPEFPFLGDLYDRFSVDAVAPYASIKVSESARDESAYEPDLIR